LNDQSTSQKGAATRDRIIEAARELFYKQGYTATGIAQILKASGANSGSLYHFFPSKEDLLVAVLEKYKSMLEPQVLKPSYERVSDPIERIFAVLDGYRQWLLATDFELGCPIGNLALEVGNSHPRARALITENLDAWCDAIRRLIEDASGRLPDDVDPPALAKHVLAIMEGAVMLSRAYRNFEPFDQAIGHLRDYFDRLVRQGSEWPLAGPAFTQSGAAVNSKENTK
jgi:AcrR family transcriptional regulator